MLMKEAMLYEQFARIGKTLSSPGRLEFLEMAGTPCRIPDV